MNFFQNTLFIACLSSLVIFSHAQYSTDENICGGWFKTQPGAIRFNFSEPSQDDLTCIWTINPASPSAYSAYKVEITRTPGLLCNASDTLTVSHFELGSTRVSTSYSWNCGTPISRPGVPGTVIVVVFTSKSIVQGTGFTLTFESAGEMVPSRLRNVNYNWGKDSSYPNYYASGFFRNEIVTHAFARGNNTRDTYNMVLTFTSLRFDCQFPDSDLNVCKNNTDSSLLSKMLICPISNTGTLTVEKVITGEGSVLDQVGGRHVGKNGVFLLIWGGDYNYAGGSMQFNYDTSL